MSLFPRLSPNGQNVITQAPGRYHPGWLDDARFVWCRGNGPGIFTSDNQTAFAEWLEPDSLSAGGGAFIANYWNAELQGIRHSSGLTVLEGYHGALSDDGRLVYLTGHASTQQVVHDTQGSTYDSGAAMERPTACAVGLTWSRYEGGKPRTYFAFWGGPKRRVQASGDLAEFRPVCVVTPSGVWIATTTHGDARVYPVGSTEGYILPSVNAQNLDAKWNGTGLRLVWNAPDAAGVLQLRDQVIDLTKPRVRLDVPPVIVVPPPVEPPVSVINKPGVQILDWHPIDADKTGVLIKFKDRNNPQFGEVTVWLDEGYVRVEIENAVDSDKSSKKDRKVI